MTDIPDFDILVRPVRLQNVLRRDTHGAETMEDGLVEATNCSELGLDLENATF